VFPALQKCRYNKVRPNVSLGRLIIFDKLSRLIALHLFQKGTVETTVPTKTMNAKTEKSPGWIRRNFKRAVLILLVLVVGGGGALYGKFYMEAKPLLDSEAFKHALDVVAKNKQVQEAIGTPIKYASWFPSGEVNGNAENGTANINFDIQGPKGKAGVNLQARAVNKSWGYSKLDVATAGSETKLNLKDEANAGSVDDTPKFTGNNNQNQEQPKIDLPPPNKDINIEIPM
jgi:hypothetical protein